MVLALITSSILVNDKIQFKAICMNLRDRPLQELDFADSIFRIGVVDDVYRVCHGDQTYRKVNFGVWG